MMTDEQLAELFHETYERLAPEYGYETRRGSAVPWDEVPEDNKELMIATVKAIRPALEAGLRRTLRFKFNVYGHNVWWLLDKDGEPTNTWYGEKDECVEFTEELGFTAEFVETE